MSNEALAAHSNLAAWLFWISLALVSSLPLAGLSLILHRAGRRGIWPSFPWALAMVCGPTYGMILWLLQGEGYFQFGYVLGWIAAWASGAGIAIGVSVVVFAVVGVGPPPKG